MYKTLHRLGMGMFAMIKWTLADASGKNASFFKCPLLQRSPSAPRYGDQIFLKKSLFGL